MDPESPAMGASLADDAAALAAPETHTGPVGTQLAQPDLSALPSILDDLARMRASLGANAKPITIPIPGYDGALVARYRWVHPKELTATSESLRAIENATDQQIAAAADALVACNDQILVRNGDVLEPLLHDNVPVTFRNGEGLSLALRLPKPADARTCAMDAFGNPYAVVDSAEKLMVWLEDTTSKVDQSHLGK